MVLHWLFLFYLLLDELRLKIEWLIIQKRYLVGKVHDLISKVLNCEASYPFEVFFVLYNLLERIVSSFLEHLNKANKDVALLFVRICGHNVDTKLVSVKE